ncbi:MAG: hypothetical protein ACRCT8_12770 [Lacipirellulaceae bacterium]
METLEEQIAPQVRTMQVIVVGLASSPIVFAVIAHLLPQSALDPEPRGLLIKVALVVGLVGLVAQDVVHRVVASMASKAAAKAGRDDPTRFAGAYLSAVLMSSGVAEAAAMICLLAYWITRDQMTFAMAAMLVIANLMKYPTPAKVAAWAKQQMAEAK